MCVLRGKEVISDLTEINAALRVLVEGINPIDPIEEQIARLNIASLSTEQREKLRGLLNGALDELKS